MTRTLPKSSGRNAVLIREIIEDLNKRTLEGDSSALIIDDYILNLARLGDYNWALDGPQLITAREMGIIDCLPKVLQSEIEDKSNSDFLVKFVAVAQVVWQIIQLIIRWTKGLPSSQAEVATVGFSFCAFIMYLAFWSKPQDVETPYVVKAKRYPTKEEILQLAERGPILDGIWTGYSYSVPEHAIHSDLRDTHEKGLDGGVVGWAGVALGGVLFGLMHVSAWSFNFPTPIEKLLWRITSTITTILPVLSFARGLCWLALARGKRDPSKGLINANTLSAKNPAVQYIGVGGLSIYMLSRLYLIVETFRSLLYLLPDTYQTTV
jgi:hypothetical protein